MPKAEWKTVALSDPGRIRMCAGRLAAFGYDFQIIERGDTPRLRIRAYDSQFVAELVGDLKPQRDSRPTSASRQAQLVRLLVALPLGAFSGAMGATYLDLPEQQLPLWSAGGAIVLAILAIAMSTIAPWLERLRAWAARRFPSKDLGK